MRMIPFRRWSVLSGSVVALLVVASILTGPASARTMRATQLKVALIAPSGRGDHAFTQSMYAALRRLEPRYHFILAVSENQFVVEEAGRLMRQYAQHGYGLIIAHGSQYGETVRHLAPEYPGVSFAWGTATTNFGLRNVYAYSAASNQGGYVQGYIAALLSRTKVVGGIGPVRAGDAKLYIDGFKAGAKSANPNVVVHTGYTGSFSDPSLMAARAEKYVKAKADMLTGSSQAVVGAITVCKDRGVGWFGTQWSQAPLAPAHVVSSQVYDWRVVLRAILNGVHSGRLGGATYSIKLKNGGEKIAFNPHYSLPKAVRSGATKMITRIKNGTIIVPQ
jgi:basic membrane lipoprotein Med (substrate-binding protein (PBP1-ABC) superfamily)